MGICHIQPFFCAQAVVQGGNFGPLFQINPKGHGAVDGQHVRIADPVRPQVADQSAAKACAVKEKIPFDPRPTFKGQRRDAAFPLINPPHLIVDHRNALGLFAQPSARAGLIEVEGVVKGASGNGAAVFQRHGGAVGV